MNPDEKTPVETLPESQTQFVGAALSATRYGILFDSHDQRRIEVSLKGHRVVGGGYTGDLQCTGLTHWRVAELTSNFIGSRSRLFKNKFVLELGCGLGLCGIVAAHAVGGEGTVLLTDRDSEVLEIAASNIARNEIDRSASTTRLAWDDDVTAERILEEYSSRNSRNKKGFDVIIGSDCLYSGMTAVRQLFSTVAHMLYDDSEDNFEEIVQEHDVEDDDGCDDIDSLPTSPNGGGWKYLQQHTKNFDSRTDIDMSAATPALHTPLPVPVPTPNPFPVRSVFVLGYERRLGGAEVDMSAMFGYATELGLEWCIAEDSVIDIFGNETSERTLFWEQCVLLFTRHKK